MYMLVHVTKVEHFSIEKLLPQFENPTMRFRLSLLFSFDSIPSPNEVKY